MIVTSNGRTVREVLAAHYLRVPRFQRPYEWDRSNVEDFWTDVRDSEREYFVGAMVVFPSVHGTHGIVDGQQRITTITLLLCALRDALRGADAIGPADGLQNLIERRSVNDNSLHFVLQNDIDSPFLRHMQSGRSADAPGPMESERALRAAHQYLVTQVREYSNEGANPAEREERLLQLRDKVLDLRLVLVEVGTEDDATVIFQTLNSRGRDLEIADLVKSHLLSLLPADNPANDLARDKWNSIQTSFEESQADLAMDRFLLHTWLSAHDYVAQRGLAKPIRRYLRQADDAQEFLDDLVTDARLYRELHEPGYRAAWQMHEFPLRQALEALQLFRVRQPLPWLLSVWREYDAHRLPVRHVLTALRTVESFHLVATAVTNQPSSGGVSKMYASHARQLKEATDRSAKVAVVGALNGRLATPSRLPTLEQFTAGFAEIRRSTVYSQQARLAQYVLRQIHDFNSAQPADLMQLTVEHIAPQGSGRPLSVAEADVARLGNLILVPATLNAELSDLPFRDKQQRLRDASAAGLWVDPYILESDEWGTEEIVKRTESLAHQAYNEIWSLKPRTTTSPA